MHRSGSLDASAGDMVVFRSICFHPADRRYRISASFYGSAPIFGDTTIINSLLSIYDYICNLLTILTSCKRHAPIGVILRISAILWQHYSNE